MDSKSPFATAAEQIKHRIQTHGPITFDQFMEYALYSPQTGYYQRAHSPIGAKGDFITAPEISPLFSYCIAKQCQQVLEHLGNGDILELGAGNGTMAADILNYLAQHQTLPEHYYIHEISSTRVQQQQHYLQQHCAPNIYERIHWLKDLSAQKLSGVIIANEVIDALPVHVFKIERDQIYEQYVTVNNNNEFEWYSRGTSFCNFIDFIEKFLMEGLCDRQYYTSEINLRLANWLSILNQSLTQGLMLFVDYGFPRHEYYHPDRAHGTLMCHYQHTAHANPLLHVGEQDITAHVDFTAVAEYGEKLGLWVSGYTTQAYFLMACGLLEEANQLPEKEAVFARQAIKKLIQPHEMGELFKVIALTRTIDLPLIGFTLKDFRPSLIR